MLDGSYVHFDHFHMFGVMSQPEKNDAHAFITDMLMIIRRKIDITSIYPFCSNDIQVPYLSIILSAALTIQTDQSCNAFSKSLK